MILMMLQRQYKSLLASLSMYTRLPAWRLIELDRDDYARGIQWLPFVGFVTGGLMAGVFYLTYAVLALPLVSAIVLALVARLVFTGAFHEDGLGDFFDGFGGGRDRETILRIMKDSHVGSYAVIAYIVYYALLISLLSALPTTLIPIALLLSDVLGKYLGTLPISYLPYARNLEESKLGIKYEVGGLMPRILTLILLVGLLLGKGLIYLAVFALPLILLVLLSYYIYRKIGGYTGDTCGAFILICELASIFSFVLLR